MEKSKNATRSKKAKKIIIFYSSIGAGHLSAAHAIQKEINEADSSAIVILQDIRAFINPVWRKIDEKIYWLIASNLPNTFDVLFRSAQANGNRVFSLSSLPRDYQENKIVAFVLASSPDVILTTHYGSAQALGVLREKSLLPDIPLGWMHTDFFDGYMPRISKLIDHTFLAHPRLEKKWLAAGVPQDKISTSGMPIQIPSDDRNAQQKLQQQLGLDPNIPIVVISNGKEGVGDYRVIIESITKHYKRRLQVVAICGKNIKQEKKLLKFSKRLPSQVTLTVLGYIPHPEMMSLMKMATVLIAKAGGITPAEAFSIGLPTVLLNLVSGHERENAAMFVELGLAKMVLNVGETGIIITELLTDRQQLQEMIEAQHNFSKYINCSKIVEFVFNRSDDEHRLPSNFGSENGTPVVNAHQIIKQLNDEIPSDIELLLSYSTSVLPERISRENPFGHIAIRVGDIVYSAHYKADQKTDLFFLQHYSLADYLYGTQKQSSTQVHANTYGMAYGRETLGFRISGISPARIQAMMNQINSIEEKYKKNILHWNKYKYNCADIVALILQAGGYDPLELSNKLGLPTMPLDVFENTLAIFSKDASLQKKLVMYKKISYANAHYKFSHFPLSLWRPARSLRCIIHNSHNPSDAKMVINKIIAISQGRLFIEDMQLNYSNVGFNDYEHSHNKYLHTFSAFIIDMMLQIQTPLKF